jgi:hypothetical protein
MSCVTAEAQNRDYKNINDTTAVDTILPKRNTFKLIFSGEPGKAALYSLIIPSGGQIYNRKWWKVPLALGVDGWFTYRYLHHRSEFNKYDKIYKDWLKGIPNEISIDNARIFRNSSRQAKEYGFVYLILGHLATVFDAYVDRHLMDFDSSEDVSFTKNYYAPDNSITLVKFRLPIHQE